MGQRWTKYWNQAITLIILINLILVFFNLSYIPLRREYLEYVPQVTEIYDPVRGIISHPVTERYLDTVAQLQQSLASEGLEADQTTALLTDLRQQSQVLITENPFSSSRQDVLFAELKRRIQAYMHAPSAQEALNQFWQADFLQQTGPVEAITFFDYQIAPLLRQNYYQQILDIGQPVNYFWLIDLAFIALFVADFLVRTWLISLHHKYLDWGDAIARHWYELPLFFPFWRWLRILPATIRLHRTGLVNVEHLLSQVTHEPAAYLSDRVVRFALVQFVNQTRASIKAETLFQRLSPTQDYTEVGKPGKLERLGDRLLQRLIYGVIPHIKPELGNVLRHNLQNAVMQSNLYDRLRQIPGLNTLPATVLNTLATQLAQTTCDILIESYADTEGRLLVDQLSQAFQTSLAQQIQDALSSNDIKALLNDWLEEIKLNYIQQPNYHDPIAILEEAEQLKRYPHPSCPL